ncbi:MAG: hypothetical protein H0X51_09565 [Parachlamydiaceae bacterium]|nr:hypothetical protein [Parachlamydiaceae bacterium]
MKGFFRKLFNIYAGEEKAAILFAVLGFLWALGVTSGQKFADALFLIHIGAESLPIAYTFSACVMMLMAAFLIQAFNRISVQRIFITVLLTGALFYSFAYLSMVAHANTEPVWLWFALKIFGSVFFAIVVTCFWTFIDQYFHLQDAKRLYSLFSSSIFLGIATTGLIMRSGWIAIEQLTLFIIVLLICASAWILYILPRLTPVYDESNIESSSNSDQSSFRVMFLSILRSRFTLFLMAGNFLTYVLLVITEYSYMSAFDQHFDHGVHLLSGGEETAQLTLFLGKCITAVSIFNLIFGMFVYSRLVRQFGISNLVLYTPILLVFIFSGWLIDTSLFFPVMGFFVVEGMLYIVDDNNFTLLLNAVPSRMKYKIRLMIESFFEPTGMLISSMLIFFVPINSKLLGLILATVALIVAFTVRKHYLKAIFINLSENAIHLEHTSKSWFSSLNKKDKRSTEKRLLSILEHKDEQAQLFAIEALTDFDDRILLHHLLNRSDTLSTQSKIALLNAISKGHFENDSQLIDRLHQWLLQVPDPQLKSAIHFFLAKQGLLHPDKILQDLDSPDVLLRASAIMALKRSWAHLSPQAATANRNVAAQYLQVLLDSPDEEDVCMGVTILGFDALPQDVDILIPFLKSPSIKIARSAAASIALIADKNSIRYAPTLISQLEESDSEIRQSCLRALGKIDDSSLVKPVIISSLHFRPNERRLTEIVLAQMGLRTVPILMAIIKDTGIHDRCRLLAARTLGRISLPQLRAHLYSIVNQEIAEAYFYFYHAHTIQEQHPDVNLTMLQNALMNNFHSIIDFIIQVLAIAGESENSELLSRSLRSPNPKVRSHVVETLERTCENRIFRALYPLVADLPHAEKLHAFERAGHKALSLPALLDYLSDSPSQGDRIIAAALKYQLDLPNWRESLRQQMKTHEEVFHHFAYELLET